MTLTTAMVFPPGLLGTEPFRNSHPVAKLLPFQVPAVRSSKACRPAPTRWSQKGGEPTFCFQIALLGTCLLVDRLPYAASQHDCFLRWQSTSRRGTNHPTWCGARMSRHSRGSAGSVVGSS